MNEEQYVEPGLSGLFTRGEPGYRYMGPNEYMSGVSFSGPALEMYTGARNELPPMIQTAAGPRTYAHAGHNEDIAGSGVPLNPLPIATGNQFKTNAEALAAANSMYRDVIASINPEAVKDTYYDPATDRQILGHPELFLTHKQLPGSTMATYSPTAHRVEYPVYQDLFAVDTGYYKQAPYQLNVNQENPQVVKQMFQHGGVQGPLDRLSLSHELGHAYDNRANANKRYDYDVEHALASDLQNQPMWEPIISSWAAGEADKFSDKLNTAEAFAEYFGPALDQEVSQRYLKQSMPYYEQVIPQTDYSRNKDYQQGRAAGLESYKRIQDVARANAAQYEKDIAPIIDMPVIAERLGRVYQQDPNTPAYSYKVKPEDIATREALTQEAIQNAMNNARATVQSPGFVTYKPTAKTQSGRDLSREAYDMGVREAETRAKADFLDMFLNRPLQ